MLYDPEDRHSGLAQERFEAPPCARHDHVMARLGLGTSKIDRDMHVAMAMITVVKKMYYAHCIRLLVAKKTV